MAKNKYTELAKKSADLTDKEFQSEMANLVTLKADDIDAIMNRTGVSKEELALLIKTVQNATTYNEKTASAIANINKGVNVLFELAKKVL